MRKPFWRAVRTRGLHHERGRFQPRGHPHGTDERTAVRAVLCALRAGIAPFVGEIPRRPYGIPAHLLRGGSLPLPGGCGLPEKPTEV